MMGELKFFLGLQVHQSPCGIFISQLKYTIELLKKHGMDECDSISTPMATIRLDTDLQGTPIDQTRYRSMIGGLMYLTASRPDITFATFDSDFELIAFSDADHVGCHDDCKSTFGGLQFLEFHKIIKDEIAPLVNQVDARVQNFKNHFVKEAAKFVRDFKSLAKEANESLDKILVLEKENERLLRTVVSQDIMSIVQSPYVVKTSDLQTGLECTKEREDKFVHINQARASVMTKLITVSQPHVITKQDVNSNSNGLSSIGVNTTTKTRMPQPRSNTKNDKAPSASKSSCTRLMKLK
ncbi:retrovirus-related pol polyprotein from transposon TNT 1-94 [Tanacetum coccineum]